MKKFSWGNIVLYIIALVILFLVIGLVGFRLVESYYIFKTPFGKLLLLLSFFGLYLLGTLIGVVSFVDYLVPEKKHPDLNKMISKYSPYIAILISILAVLEFRIHSDGYKYLFGAIMPLIYSIAGVFIGLFLSLVFIRSIPFRTRFVLNSVFSVLITLVLCAIFNLLIYRGSIFWPIFSLIAYIVYWVSFYGFYNMNIVLNNIISEEIEGDKFINKIIKSIFIFIGLCLLEVVSLYLEEGAPGDLIGINISLLLIFIILVNSMLSAIVSIFTDKKTLYSIRVLKNYVTVGNYFMIIYFLTHTSILIFKTFLK